MGDQTWPNTKTVVRRAWPQMQVMERGEGVYLYDVDGKRYLDGSAGSSVCVNIGHGVKSVRDAVYGQMEKVSYSPTHLFATQSQMRLGELVADKAPGTMRNRCRSWFTCTGTDSVDAAISLARQYHVATGNRSKTLVIGRWQGFHGNSLGIAGIHGHTYRRRMFTGMNVNMPHIPPAYCYRCPFELSYPSCGLKCARALETEIRQQGEENIAAFIAEPVVGAALGAVPAPEGYFETIREICDKYNVLMVVDEVMTAWGRTGYWFGIEHWGVTPDIVAAGKGLAAGYAAIAATTAREEIWAPVEEMGNPSFLAGHTMDGNPVACSAALEVIRHVDEHDLLRNARETGTYLRDQLETLLDIDIVGDVRGLGMMCGFELVRDKQTKEPFDAGLHIGTQLQSEALARGLILFACTGSLEGVAGDMMLVTPPLTINPEQVDELVGITRAALEAVRGAVRQA